MALSKRTLKRRFHNLKAMHVLILSAAARMDHSAQMYNDSFQQSMSAKHHPDEVYREGMQNIRTGLWAAYEKDRKVFIARSRKFGKELTQQVLAKRKKKNPRAHFEAMGLNKPAMIRKHIAGTKKPFIGRPVISNS